MQTILVLGAPRFLSDMIDVNSVLTLAGYNVIGTATAVGVAIQHFGAEAAGAKGFAFAQSLLEVAMLQKADMVLLVDRPLAQWNVMTEDSKTLLDNVEVLVASAAISGKSVVGLRQVPKLLSQGPMVTWPMTPQKEKLLAGVQSLWEFVTAAEGPESTEDLQPEDLTPMSQEELTKRLQDAGVSLPEISGDGELPH